MSRERIMNQAADTNSINSRGVTMRMPSNVFKTSRSASPVTRCEQPESSAAARMRLSSASRQRWMLETTRTASVCCSTKKAIKRACRGENPNFSRSFSSISSSTSSDAMNRCARRAVRQTPRQNPSVVKMASQTLLSRRTRTGQGENFLFGQTVLAGQAVKCHQRAVQFVFRRKKILIDALDLLIGQVPDFFNDLRCVHVPNLTAALEKATRDKNDSLGSAPTRWRFGSTRPVLRGRTAEGGHVASLKACPAAALQNAGLFNRQLVSIHIHPWWNCVCPETLCKSWAQNPGFFVIISYCQLPEKA